MVLVESFAGWRADARCAAACWLATARRFLRHGSDIHIRVDRKHGQERKTKLQASLIEH
jgi:hypothetical protein